MLKTITGVQRYNNRMQKVYNNAIEQLQKYCKHTFYLKQDSFSKQQYHRECNKCGKKAKQTPYNFNS